MKFLQPVSCTGLQEALHFSSRMIKIFASPFAVAHIYVGIFIQGSPVIISQSVVIHGKMHRNKVKDDTDVVLMGIINQIFQFVRATVAGGRTVKAGLLISPGIIAGMFRKGHEFYIIVAVVLNIGDKRPGDFGIGIPGSVFFGHPGAQMDFIDIQCGISAVRSLCHPFGIFPGKAVRTPDNGGRLRRHFHAGAVRVGMVGHPAIFLINSIFIFHFFLHTGNLTFPEIPVICPLHWGV